VAGSTAALPLMENVGGEPSPPGNAAAAAGGGMDSRTAYHDRWASFARTAAQEVTEEAEAEKQASQRCVCHIRSAALLLVRLSRRRSRSRALGLDKPLSSGAQAKVDALRAAKAHWQSRQEQELQAKARERSEQELQQRRLLACHACGLLHSITRLYLRF